MYLSHIHSMNVDQLNWRFFFIISLFLVLQWNHPLQKWHFSAFTKEWKWTDGHAMHVISIVTVYHWPMPTIYQHSYDRWCFLEWAHQNMTQTIYIKPRILPSCPTVNKYVGNWPCRRPHEYHQSLSSYLGNSLCSSLRHMSNKSMNFWGNWAKSTNNPCWVFRLKKKRK